MIDRRPPFGADELPDDVDAAELATSLAMGRELNILATASTVEPPAGFSDRVLLAIASEPVPQPGVAVEAALRGGRPVAVLAALRDAWRVAFSGGRPALVRAQALALVLVAGVAIGSVLSAGALAAAGALGMFDAPSPLPAVPSPSDSPTPAPSPSLSPAPTPVVTPLVPTQPPTQPPTATPTETNEPSNTDGPDETQQPEGTDDGGGGNPGPGGGGSGADDSQGDDSSGGRSGSDD